MSIAKAMRFRKGKVNETTLYVKIKNGNIYRHPTPMSFEQMKVLIQAIRDNDCRIKLNNWELARAK